MNPFCKQVIVVTVFACAAYADPAWDVRETGDSIDITLAPGPMQVITQGQGVVVSAGPGAAVVNIGEPDVPVLVRVFKARPGRHARVAVVSAEDVQEQSANVLPRPFETVETVDDDKVRRVTVLEPDPDVYLAGGFWPEPQARVTEAAMGTNVYIRLAVYPVQYNPLRQTLRSAGIIKIRVSFDESHAGADKTGP